MEDNKGLIKAPHVSVSPFENDRREILANMFTCPMIKHELAIAQNSIRVSVGKAIMTAGQTVDPDEVQFIASEIYDRCERYYPYVTLEEIECAIKKGVYGDYGQYFGVNAKSCMHFVESYIKSEERRQAILKYESGKLLPEPKRLTRREWKALIQKDYEHFSKGDLALIVFTPKKFYLLKEIDFITITPERWEKWILRATEAIRYDKTVEARLKGNSDVAKEYKKIFETLETKGEIDDKEVIHIEVKAMEMIYMEFLLHCRKIGMETIF